MICNYGCGQEANHQFKNGKWCCSFHHTKCPSRKKDISKMTKGKVSPNKGKKFSKEHIEKLSKSHKGYILSEEHKRKISLSNKGKHTGKKHSVETKRKLSKIMTNKPGYWKNKTFSDEHKHRISESNKGKIISKKQREIISIANKGKNSSTYGKVFSKDRLKKMSIVRIIPISKLKKKYPTFAKIEEMRYAPGKEKEKVIQVHCKNHNCPNSKEKGGWFIPTKDSFYRRVHAIEHNDGNEGRFLYCSEECKEECPLYRKSVQQLIKDDLITAGHIPDPLYTSEEYKIWRDYIFGLDNGLCVYCGKPATIAHHINPQKTHPEEALDPSSGISCCQECHFKYGHRDSWCTTGYLSKLICERIIRIKNIEQNNIKGVYSNVNTTRKRSLSTFK